MSDKLYRWVKASERLPDLTQYSENELHFQFDGKKVCGVHFMSDGFEVKILSIYTGYYNEHFYRLEWLSEIEADKDDGWIYCPNCGRIKSES